MGAFFEGACQIYCLFLVNIIVVKTVENDNQLFHM